MICVIKELYSHLFFFLLCTQLSTMLHSEENWYIERRQVTWFRSPTTSLSRLLVITTFKKRGGRSSRTNQPLPVLASAMTPLSASEPSNLNRVTECTPFSCGLVEGQALIITSKVHDSTEYSNASALCTYLVAASWKLSSSVSCECCALEAKFTHVCRTSDSKRCFLIVCWQSCRLQARIHSGQGL